MPLKSMFKLASYYEKITKPNSLQARFCQAITCLLRASQRYGSSSIHASQLE